MAQEQRASQTSTKTHWQLVEEALDEHRGKKREARRVLRRGPERSRPGPSRMTGHPPTLFLTETVIRRTVELLGSASGPAARADAARPGVVYWFGFEFGERACVTTLMIPEEVDRADSILASAVANEEVFTAIVSASLVFLAEVRPRPDEGPEPPDEYRRDVRFEGAFSIEVSPCLPFHLEDCRVRRQVGGECREIEIAELEDHLRLIPGFKDLRRRGRLAPCVVTPPIRHVVQV